MAADNSAMVDALKMLDIRLGKFRILVNQEFVLHGL